MKIRRDFLTTRDIDWFCIVSGIPIHAASAGCEILPDLVNDREKLIRSQHIAANLPNKYNNIFVNLNLVKKKLEKEISNDFEEEGIEDLIDVNTPLLEEWTMEERIEFYKSSFVSYAQKGFFSFDRSEPENPESPFYDLIAFPVTDSFNLCQLSLPSTQNNFFSNFSSTEEIIQNLSRFERLDLNKLLSNEKL